MPRVLLSPVALVQIAGNFLPSPVFKSIKGVRHNAILAIPTRALGLKFPRLLTHLDSTILFPTAPSGSAITPQIQRQGITRVVELHIPRLTLQAVAPCELLASSL